MKVSAVMSSNKLQPTFHFQKELCNYSKMFDLAKTNFGSNFLKLLWPEVFHVRTPMEPCWALEVLEPTADVPEPVLKVPEWFPECLDPMLKVPETTVEASEQILKVLSQGQRCQAITRGGKANSRSTTAKTGGAKAHAGDARATSGDARTIYRGTEWAQAG